MIEVEHMPTPHFRGDLRFGKPTEAPDAQLAAASTNIKPPRAPPYASRLIGELGSIANILKGKHFAGVEIYIVLTFSISLARIGTQQIPFRSPT